MKIDFNYELDFVLQDESKYSDWINRIISSQGKSAKSLTYIFSDDEYLADINFQYLNHNTYTDIVTFDYSDGDVLAGDIFISIDRVMDNAKTYKVPFENELKRVMSHGILHLMGYQDKTDEQKQVMRKKEEEAIALFHVEQLNPPPGTGKDTLK